MSEYLDKITLNGTDYDLHDTGSREAIAPKYSDLVFPVAAGKICWYNGALYRAIADILASESWTAAHWEEAVIGEDLAALSAAVTALQALPTDTVLYGASQSLTDAQKTQARGNIGAAGQNDLAPLFSTSVSYTVGQYVYYNDGLYRFTADHAAGAWTGTDVAAVVYGRDVYDLKSAINVLEPTATAQDVGKALIAKTVTNGKVTEYEFGETITLDDTLTHEGEAADAKATGDAISVLTDDLTAIENLESQEQTAVLSPFVQGSVAQATGVINPASTNACYIGKLPMKSGDTFTFSRSVNKITTTCTLVIYDTGGVYVSGRGVATGTTITFENDGMFAIACGLNSNVSATMEEAIAAANTSFTATLTTQFEIVSKINSLDADVEDLKDFESSVAPVIELSEKIIVSDGVAYDQNSLLTGKYYSVSNGVVSINTELSSKYCNLVDVSALRGHRLIVWVNSVKSGSTRAFGFCDAENNVGNYNTETNMMLMPDGTRMTILLVDKDYMFFSCSSTPADISVEIATEYLFPKVAEMNRRMETRKYYHFSFDDVYLCLQDITTNASTYQSIFENSFLAWCKEMHDKYGTTFSMYVFYQNAASNPTWTLEDCTNAFAAEFTANADWLKFGFHAHDPESTATSRASSASSDYSSAMTQLVRITGSVACIDRVPRLHNYNGSLEAITAMRDCDLGPVGLIASADYSSSQPRDSYYFDAAQNAYIAKHIYMYDAENFLHFVKTSLIWADPNGEPDENDPANVNADKYVELFTHENQLTSGMKTTYEKKIAKLAYYHLPYYMMDLVLTN